MPHYYASTERRSAGLRDHHVHRRAFLRLDDTQLHQAVSEVLRAWEASFHERPLSHARDWHPDEHRDIFHRHLRALRAQSSPQAASRDALDFLQGRDHDKGSRCGRQIRALGRVLLERRLHTALWRLSAGCAAFEPQVTV